MEPIKEPEAKAEGTEAKAEVKEIEASAESQQNTEAKAEASESSETVNERLLKESKAWKAKALEAQKELERQREAEKKKQGKYQELAEEYKAKLDELQKKIIKEKVQTALIQAAPKYGYAGKSYETLLRLGDHSLLQYDEVADDVQGVDIYMESLKKIEPALFKSVDARINDKAPSIDSIVKRPAPTTLKEQEIELKRKLAESLQKGV